MGWAAPASSGSIVYSYDQAGRLTGVADDTSSAAQYTYDALGNIVSVTNLAAASVSIIDFTPDTGAAGGQVTITGTGFSTTPNLNAVAFNGLSAVMVSATATRLVVNVPAGVTTGPITVTSPSGSATSSTHFVVSGTSNVPTITGFAPLIGSPGTTVMVTGTNFDARTGVTKVQFNQSTASLEVTNVALTSLTAKVPANAASGKLRVITPAGYADSATDFIVPPSTIVSTDIVDAKRIALGGSQTLNITPTNKIGVLLIDGGSSPYRTLNISALTTSPAGSTVPYEIYSPRGGLIARGSIGSSALPIHLPALSESSTYAVYFMPGAATASMTFALTANKLINVDGVAVPESIAQTGQTARLTFNGTAGQNLGVGITGLTLSPSTSSYASVTVYKPDGSTLTGDTCYTSTTASGGCGLTLTNLPATGTYAVVVTPVSGGTGSFAATLSSDLTGMLTAGTAYSLNLVRAGQNGRLSFSGTAGAQLGLTLSSVVVTGSTPSGRVTIFNPDGTSLGLFTFTSGATEIQDLRALPLTGNYTITIDPPNAAPASMQVLLTADVTVPLTPFGPASNVSILQTGQTARLTFNGTAGQNLGLGITGLTLSPSASYFASVKVYRPDDTYSPLTAVNCYTAATANGGCAIELTKLPVTGTYTVAVTPVSGGTGSFTATLSSELTSTLTAGTAYSLNLARAGQNGRLSFSGTAGAQLGLTFSSVVVTGSTLHVWATILKPDGTILKSLGFTNGAAAMDLPTLPVTGNYTVLIDPPDAATASMQVLLRAATAVPLTLDGAASHVSFAQPGQETWLTFNATTGQNLSLAITGLTLSPSALSYAVVTIYRPDEVYFDSFYCYTSYVDSDGCGKKLTNLLQTGTYSIQVRPGSSDTGSFTATLSSDVTGTLTPGTAFNLNLARAGQTARLTFSGTAGTNRSLTFSTLSTVPAGGPVFLGIYQPDGILSYGTNTVGPSFTWDLTNLPATGNYTLIAYPNDASTASMSVTISP